MTNLKTKTARELALIVLYAVEVEEAYSNIALDKLLEKYKPEKKDRGFITELVYGTLRHLYTLDWVLGNFLKKPIKDLTPWIRNILRLSVYQLMFMNKVPESAAVNEGVKLAKRYGHPGTVKFVNGVLRNVIRKLEELQFPDLHKEPVKNIAVKYSHPEWLVERWIKEFGIEETIKLCEANNVTPPNTIRVNTLKTTREELKKILEDEGVEAEDTLFAPEGLNIKGFTSLGRLKSFKEGLFQVQDESSMLVARVVDPKPGELIVDACSAPGGKTTHLAQLMENRGKIIAADIFPHKLVLVNENSKRLGIEIIETIHRDARELKEVLETKADRVLVDAPCSGLGVLRRRPEIRWRKMEAQLKEFQELQLCILNAAGKILKSGGILVYSTCSISREENREVVEKFLADNWDFAADDLTPHIPRGVTGDDLTKGYVQIMPHLHGMDGFFIARLMKK